MTMRFKDGTPRRGSYGRRCAFVAGDLAAPNLTTFTVTNIGQNTALVTLVSDEDARFVWDLVATSDFNTIVLRSDLEWADLAAGQVSTFTIGDFPTSTTGIAYRIRITIEDKAIPANRRSPRPFVNFTSAAAVAGDTTPPNPTAISVSNITTSGARANFTVDEEGTYTIVYTRVSNSAVMATQGGATTVGANSVDLATGLFVTGGNIPMTMTLTVRDKVSPTPNAFTASPVAFTTAPETVATSTEAKHGSFTFTFATALQTGTFKDGYAWAVVPPAGINLTGITPAPQVVNTYAAGGAMINPTIVLPVSVPAMSLPTGTQGYDARLAAWDQTKRLTYPKTVVPNDIVTVCRPYLPASTQQRDGHIGEWGVLFLLSAAPAAGSFAPCPVSWPGRTDFAPKAPDFASKIGLLPKIDMTGLNLPTKAQIVERLSRCQAPLFTQIHSAANKANEGGYEVAMVNGMAWSAVSGKSYGEHSSEPFETAVLYLCSTASDADKTEVAEYMYARGRDAGTPWIEAAAHFRANGAHYQGFWLAVLFYLWVEGRTAQAQNLGNTFACNPMDQPIRITAGLLATLTPHDNSAWPFIYRRRKITAISGNDFTMESKAGDPPQMAFGGLLLCKDGTATTTRVTGQPSQTNEFLHTAASLTGFAVGDTIYFRPDTLPAEGTYDWQIQWGTRGASGYPVFNPAKDSPYRELNQHLTAGFWANALYQDDPAFEALVGYARQSMQVGFPIAANDWPPAIARTAPQKHLYNGMSQLWNRDGDALFTNTGGGVSVLTINNLKRNKLKVDCGFGAGKTKGYLDLSGTGTNGKVVQVEERSGVWTDIATISGGNWSARAPVSIASPTSPNAYRPARVRIKTEISVIAATTNTFKMAAFIGIMGQSEPDQCFNTAQSQTVGPAILDDDFMEIWEVDDPNAVEPVVTRYSITNAAKRTAAIARFGAMWLASGTTLGLSLVSITKPGTGRRALAWDGDTRPADGGPPWRSSRHVANEVGTGLLDKIREEGTDIGLLVELWDNADRAPSKYFGEAFWPYYVGRIWDTEATYTLGADYDSNGAQLTSILTYSMDHCLFDFDVTETQFGRGWFRRSETGFRMMGNHRYNVPAAGDNISTVKNIEEANVGRKAFHDAAKAAFFVQGPHAQNILNGEPSAGSLTDPTHPANNSIRGLERMMAYMCVEAMRAYGIIANYTLPSLTLKTIGAGRAYVDLKLTGSGTLTTERIKTGAAFPASPAAYHQQVMGFWINGSSWTTPAGSNTGFTAEIVNDGTENVVRLTPTSGAWPVGTKIRLAYHGQQGATPAAYDFNNEVQTDFPVADIGLYGSMSFPGLTPMAYPFSPEITVT